jgi:hypothetical protein
MNAIRLSADGMYYWDGQRWTSTLAADGRYRWNGTAWVPVVVDPAYPYGHDPKSAGTRVVASWTRPMQYLVAGWYGVQALFLATLPFWYISTMTRWADAMNRSQQLNPGSPTPPPDLLSNMNTTNTVMTVLFYLTIVLLFAIAVVAIAGALRRWTWAYYAILAFLGLEAIYLAFSVLSAVAVSLASSALIGQSVSPPALMVWAEIGFGIPSAALFVWMLMAILQKGPWAMKNLTASGPVAS